VRVLETAGKTGRLQAGTNSSRLFIFPGFDFKITDAMITNFHLPKSTLLMMVAAFGGKELIMKAYREAIAQRYRFYSFGDAMFIV
jgi:S-adenosylmethionine:tRNA ribosyltransferase-isomerase